MEPETPAAFVLRDFCLNRFKNENPANCHYNRPRRSRRLYEKNGCDRCPAASRRNSLSWPNQAFREVGRVDSGRFSRGNSAIKRNLPAAVWDSGKAWAAFAVGNGSTERPLRRAACGGAGICPGFPGILLRAHL